MEIQQAPIFLFSNFGVLLAKLMNLFTKEKINPMVGAAGISAFPMSSRVVQKMALEEDPGNILLMHAAGVGINGDTTSPNFSIFQFYQANTQSP